MTSHLTEKEYWSDSLLPAIMEYCTYVFVFLMFSGRLSTVREIAVFVPPGLWCAKCVLKKESDLKWREPLSIIVLFLLLSALLSCLSARDMVSSFLAFKKEYLKVALLYIVISTTFARPEKLARLLAFMAVTGVAYSLYSGYSIAKDLLTIGMINYGEIRYFATVQLFFLPFVVLQAITALNPKRLLWGIPAVSSAAEILLIGARASWIGLLGIASVWTYFLRNTVKGFVSKMAAAAIVAVILIAAVFLFFPSQYDLVKGHTLQKVQMSLRWEAWRNFLQMSQERLLTGHGLDDRTVSSDYREFFKHVNGVYPVEGWHPTSPHNQFIKILYHQGVLGLSAYLLLLGAILFSARCPVPASHCPSFVGVAIISALIGEYVIQCIFEDRSLIPLGILAGMTGAFMVKDEGVK